MSWLVAEFDLDMIEQVRSVWQKFLSATAGRTYGKPVEL